MAWLDNFLELENFYAAWKKIQSKSRCPGVDGVTVEKIEPQIEIYLEHLRQQVCNGTYRPMPLKPLTIPKKSGEWRNLAVPTIRDRILQQSLLNVFHQVMEPQFEDCSFAYRPGRSYKGAVQQLRYWYREGYRWVLDADLVKFFAQINHQRLLDEVSERVNEPLFIKLVGDWIRAGTLTREGLILPQQGIPQGAIISPILANIYLDDFDEVFTSNQYKLVRYADDFVLLARSQKAINRVRKQVEAMLATMDLQLHPDKTKLTSFQKGFKFLGHTFVGDLVIENRTKRSDWTPPKEPKPKILSPDRVVYVDPPRQKTALSEALLEATLAHEHKIPAPLYVVFGYEPRKQERIEFISKEMIWVSAMSSIYLVDQGAKVRLSHDRLVIERHKQEAMELPIAEVERILVFGNVYLTTQAMTKCLDEQIPVFYLSRFGRYKGHLWNGAEPDFYAVRSQFAQSVNPLFKQEMAAAIVEAKLWNSRQFLKRLVKDDDPAFVEQAIGRLAQYREDLSAQMSVEQIMGFEGIGAACYFQALGMLVRHPNFEFAERSYHPPKDPVNAMLSYGYALLLSNVISFLLAEGLNLCLGNLHGSDRPKAYLAFDLIEEFRSPIVDTLIIKLINQKIIKPSDFTWPNEQGGVYLNESARRV
ncbi:MAG: CRISPR-associated endonuclease Cas1, partial [Acaryochloris sp. CRU_2_0]|nr:CRISPR-associated endonuclease Cas1 [Acaryochloris sp. CRU_2_0]